MGVYNMHEIRMKKWAEDFVDVYLESGEMAAAIWARNNVPEEYHTSLHEYVKQAFDDKGYEMVYPEDDGAA
jgi:hypothetical protein